MHPERVTIDQCIRGNFNPDAFRFRAPIIDRRRFRARFCSPSRHSPIMMDRALYLVRYAQEAAWREDHRRTASGRHVNVVMALAMACPPSVDWCGYWQRAVH